MTEYDIIVIGGGPAGMIAAGRAAERGKRVLLLERGPSLGRKLLMTATGRCNVTNSASLPEFLKAFGRQGGFLRDALTTFGNAQLLDWLHARGVETVEERKGRIFPATQDAHTILQTLLDYLDEGGVEIRLNERAISLLIVNDTIVGIATTPRQYHSPHVLIATGGLSYPTTGCTGDGYDMARQAGHIIVPAFPAIVALETRETWPRKIQGTPVKNVSICARHNGRKLREIFGEALWTHYGISGPAILDISRDVVPALNQGEEVALELDFRPADAPEELDERLLHAIKKEGRKQVSTVLSDWIAARTAVQLLELAEIPPSLKMSQCSKANRKRIIQLVKHLELRVARPRPIAEAILTGGGVALPEVDSKHMESKRVKGLHFAGEVLDLDAPSGGFNLQAAFSTGYLAAEAI